jgi:hypothetical protein
MKLSLLVAYRRRAQHLEVTMEWFKKAVELNDQIEMIIVESDTIPEIDPAIIKHTNIKYHFDHSDEVFNKSKLLNIALSMAKGEFLIPYDIDNIPIEISFSKYFYLMPFHTSFLFTAYRVMSPKRYIDFNKAQEELLYCELSPEDKGKLQQLTTSERFGIHPLFLKKTIEELGGWDENYIGWGAEDNDIIYRYLQHTGTMMMQSPDLIFLHLFHDKTSGWNEEFYTQKNLQYYYSKKGIEVDF